MSASAAQLVVAGGGSARVIIPSGTVQGTIRSSAVAVVTLTATVAGATTLALGPSTLMSLDGTLSVSGTANVLSGVTVSGAANLGDGGTGTVVLDGCTVQSGAGSVSATTMSTSDWIVFAPAHFRFLIILFCPLFFMFSFPLQMVPARHQPQ